MRKYTAGIYLCILVESTAKHNHGLCIVNNRRLSGVSGSKSVSCADNIGQDSARGGETVVLH